ncbi:unnamed protein product [Dibothriocephalus latus]|uniref:Uncharacterized protein n=1 Tax=Dibothriocephalus latus TaxID=60516 RepID=A0A3P7PM94_DIBLA|nr:unnamed protein product [Dibothriocephalus latus]
MQVFDTHNQQLKCDAALWDEFKTLEELTRQQDVDHGLTTFMAAMETTQNRYADMPPYDQNIVRLDRDWGTYCKDQQPIGSVARAIFHALTHIP